ncbi:MAG: malto-oligosyltrehalose synthase, partial [Gemmatimonadota bacterium]
MPTPDATYRLQLRPEFDFHAAAALTDYLAHLGVSHLYASPYLQAAPGSAHGYDVVDPTRVNEELGGEEGHGALAAALGRAGLGQVLDIVPNHMAITGPENRWWWDVLRNGPASRYATYFDVDWDPPEPRLRNQVLIPVLGDHYGREVEGGAIRVEYDDRFVVRYHDHVLPLAPRSLGPLLQAAGHSVVDAEDRMELELLGRVLEELPEPGIPDAAARQRRQRDLVAVDHRIRRLVEQSSAIRVAIDGTLAAVNEDADRLDALLRAQNYRLAYWRVAGQELDYRRFFDIDTLAALRTGDPEVFEAVHRRVLEWLEKGVLDGVRVDHPDGLRRPGEYFRRLRGAAPEAWIVAEKILMPEEPLPPWPVDGTTGYDLLNELTGVCVDPMGEGPLTELWTEVSGDGRPFEEVVYEARQHVLREVLGADVNRLAGVFMDVCETRRRYRDFTRRELRDALVEVAACFPVYRTYVGELGAAGGGAGEAGARDRAVIARALEGARERAPGLDPDLLDFLRAILVAELDSAEARELRMRFQQLTGPVAAKGEEDTAFYRYHRLVALNEVGGDPGRWGVSPERFHARMRERAAEHPTTMNALSTHDTKRSEDVRARLVLLSEIPGAWADAVRRWRTRNAPYWAGDVAPDPATEYLLYQTMVGAWPIDEGRLAAYLEKATREGKQRTSWTDPDPAYDAALEAFVAQLYGSGFDEEVAAFVEPLVGAGRVIALAQKLVQLMAPGVPDIYQGTELWDLSLVDPDNRRAVDFDVRRGILTELDAGPSPER